MIAFSGNPLDRASEKRGDAAWLAAQRSNSRARVLPLWKLQPLLFGPEDATKETQLGFIDGELASGLGACDAVEVFLGLDHDGPRFARDISALADPLAASLASHGHFRDARSAASLLASDEIAILGQAKALIDWHKRHGFCAQCGAVTIASDGGYRRVCPQCKAEHFPRTDPAVIMLVTAGDHCLLGRNKRFAGGLYSTLAGFVEPGETIEEAVRREVYEEVRVRVGSVHYYASQPWPFPSSLMIGCFAQSLSREIEVDGNEILAARWFERAEVKRMLEGESHEVKLPRRDAIAHHLIRNWADGT
ncbi:MAG: diphosphatase [Alphaproteobacteria bacterium]|jgi:NAD+ diphosphatase|nr:diphosphatase [Alphaproteobacteria bacterium]